MPLLRSKTKQNTVRSWLGMSIDILRSQSSLTKQRQEKRLNNQSTIEVSYQLRGNTTEHNKTDQNTIDQTPLDTRFYTLMQLHCMLLKPTNYKQLKLATYIHTHDDVVAFTMMVVMILRLLFV